MAIRDWDLAECFERIFLERRLRAEFLQRVLESELLSEVDLAFRELVRERYGHPLIVKKLEEAYNKAR